MIVAGIKLHKETNEFVSFNIPDTTAQLCEGKRIPKSVSRNQDCKQRKEICVKA